MRRVDHRPSDNTTLRPARQPDVDLAAGLSESDYAKKTKKQQTRNTHIVLLYRFILPAFDPHSWACRAYSSKIRYVHRKVRSSYRAGGFRGRLAGRMGEFAWVQVLVCSTAAVP